MVPPRQPPLLRTLGRNDELQHGKQDSQGAVAENPAQTLCTALHLLLPNRFDYLQERVVSSLKVREEQFQKLLASEAKCVLLRASSSMTIGTAVCQRSIRFPPLHCRTPIVQFFENAEVVSLLVFMDGKELAAVGLHLGCCFSF
jgi:hypothetical protein